jgi:hypothetical protein
VFAGKAEPTQVNYLSCAPLKGMLLALPTNTRLGPDGQYDKLKIIEIKIKMS